MNGHGWQDRFDFIGEMGCVPTFVGFILFVIAITVLKRFLIG
jgi:hypothetical protein